MSDVAPGRPFDGWRELKFAIGELQALAARLGVQLHADEEGIEAATWDTPSWRAADLLERTLADIGTLAAWYVRLSIFDRRGIEPP